MSADTAQVGEEDLIEQLPEWPDVATMQEVTAIAPPMLIGTPGVGMYPLLP